MLQNNEIKPEINNKKNLENFKIFGDLTIHLSIIHHFKKCLKRN